MAKPETETLTLKPAEGRRVRHEDGRLLAAEGEAVASSPYWLRRLADADVVEDQPRRRAAKPAPTPET